MIVALAEMGDKTQVATVMLAAQYQAFVWVVIGTTLGMLLANALVVWLGHKLVRRVPLRLVHGISAAIFAVLGRSPPPSRSSSVPSPSPAGNCR